MGLCCVGDLLRIMTEVSTAGLVGVGSGDSSGLAGSAVAAGQLSDIFDMEGFIKSEGLKRNSEGYLTLFPLLNPKKTPTLSLPRSVIEDIVAEELKCPICWGTIDHTFTVTTCLHRFCSECLQRSLRVELSGQKNSHDCPACRAKMASRRDARQDQPFDDLIYLMTGLIGVPPGSNPTGGGNTPGGGLSSSPNRELKRRRSGASAIEGGEGETGEGAGDEELIIDLDMYRKLHQEKTEELKQRSKDLVASGKVWSGSDAYTPGSSSGGTAAKKARSSSANKESTGFRAQSQSVGPRICLSLMPSPEVSDLFLLSICVNFI
jgi:E3 ubiquitin-protein ligase RNF1/2